MVSTDSSPAATAAPTATAWNDELLRNPHAVADKRSRVQRMFAAMRETVPQDGFLGQSSAEQTFGSLLDEKLAERVPQQTSGPHSLAEALYHQLLKRIEPATQSTVPPDHRTTVPPDSTVPPDKR